MSGSLGRINPFRYRGYYYDVETGYYYLQARYYNPSIGRFISADPVLDTNSAVGLNLYAYCGNDPVNFTDATGCLKNVVYMSDAGGGGSSPYIRRILESAKLHEEVGYWHNLAYYDMYPWADPVGDGVVPPDLSSAYYTSDNALYPKYNGQCTWYVLGRALEVSGYKTPTSHAKKWYDLTPESERGQVIRSRSIAVFGGSEYGHVVFIEHWNPYSRIVTYSEANYKGRVNGTIRKATWDDFMKERVTSKILIGFIYTD